MRRAEPEQGRRVVEWYGQHRRDLPWRNTKDPYRVLVSEIMLQQTRADVVEKRYPQFIERFPTVHDLSAAAQDDVMKQWEGLGYYSRARHLQAAARHIAEYCNGEIPRTMDELLAIPGIGRYTAGAVLAIAYNTPAVAVDANAIRIVARVLALGDPVSSARAKRRIEEEMLSWLPKENPGDFAQGIMDLGALICRSSNPLCDRCPLLGFCAAAKDGVQKRFPVRSEKKKTPQEEWTAVCFTDGNRMAVEKRPQSGLLGGLYGPPMLRAGLTATGVHALGVRSGLRVLSIETGPQWSHQFSHVRWNVASWIVQVKEQHEACGFTWADRDELHEKIAVPTALRPVVRYWESIR